jgi:hypothetical protein
LERSFLITAAGQFRTFTGFPFNAKFEAYRSAVESVSHREPLPSRWVRGALAEDLQGASANPSREIARLPRRSVRLTDPRDNRYCAKRRRFAVTYVSGTNKRRCGGGRGIRTPERVSPLTVFKTAGFNHSPIPPLPKYLIPKGLATLSLLNWRGF